MDAQRPPRTPAVRLRGLAARLELDRIELYQLHTPDPAVPCLESIGALKDLRSEGKIRHIGLCNVTLEQLADARSVTDISTVQNRLDFSDNRWRDMLTECESHEIGFIPYRPLRAWDDAGYREFLTPAASRHKEAPTRSPSPGCSWCLPSPCRSQAPEHARTSKTTLQPPHSASAKTR